MQISHSCRQGFHGDCKKCDCDCHLRCHECHKFDINSKPVYNNNKDFLYRLCESCYNKTMRCLKCNKYVGTPDNAEPYYVMDEENNKYRLCNFCFSIWERRYEKRN